MSLQNVKTFYERLATDEAFRTQLEAVKSKEECRQIVKNAGYDFTQEEFEEYTAQLLESSSNNDEIKDLDEKELEAVFGGALSIVYKDIDKIFLPMYGMPWPWPIDVQPSYGAPRGDLLDEIILHEDSLDKIVVNQDSLNEIVVNDDLPKH